MKDETEGRQMYFDENMHIRTEIQTVIRTMTNEEIDEYNRATEDADQLSIFDFLGGN